MCNNKDPLALQAYPDIFSLGLNFYGSCQAFCRNFLSPKHFVWEFGSCYYFYIRHSLLYIFYVFSLAVNFTKEDLNLR